MGKKININRDKVNEVYKHIIDTDARIVVCYGGRDSGKSYFVGGQYIPSLLCDEEYFRGVAVRKVYATHRDSCYQEVVDGLDSLEAELDKSTPQTPMGASSPSKGEPMFVESSRHYEIVEGHPGGMSCEEAVLEKTADEKKKAADGIKTIKSPLEISHENGNKLIFRGLDNAKKLKSLKGLNFIWVEEAEDLTRKEFYEILMLLRGGKPETQQLVLTFNPMDEEHFTNGMFVDCPADEVIDSFENGEKKVWIKYLDVEVEGKAHRIKALVLRTTYEDNAYISIERKAAIEQLAKTDPMLYEVYRLGKFGTRGGRILYNVEEVDFKKKGIQFIEYDNRGYAQDFGFNHANCILSVAEKDNNLYVFEELYGSEKDTAEWIEAANKRGYDRRLMMVCDSAEPDRIKTWVRAGYRAVAVKKYSGSVNGQIDRLKRYNRIYINSACVNTLREAREWKWKQNKKGRFIDEPENNDDDCMAALRYSGDLFASSTAEMRTVSARKRK